MRPAIAARIRAALPGVGLLVLFALFSTLIVEAAR